MAWIRTALSMINFGFTIGKIGQVMQDVTFKAVLREYTYSVSDIAYFLVALGTLSLAGAIAHHFLRVHALHALGHPRQFSIASTSATLLFLVGLFAMTALV